MESSLSCNGLSVHALRAYHAYRAVPDVQYDSSHRGKCFSHASSRLPQPAALPCDSPRRAPCDSPRATFRDINHHCDRMLQAAHTRWCDGRCRTRWLGCCDGCRKPSSRCRAAVPTESRAVGETTAALVRRRMTRREGSSGSVDNGRGPEKLVAPCRCASIFEALFRAD